MDQIDNNLPTQEVLEKIKAGQVTMRSRAFYVWRSVLMTLALIIFVVAGIFVVTFVYYTLHASGVWDLPQFGLHGIKEFLVYFPWLFIPAVLLFLWLIERFVREYSFGYRLPLLYVAGGICGFIVIASWVVLATPAHDRLFMFARSNQLPFAGGMYQFFGNAHPDDFYIGRVISSNPPQFVLENREKGKTTCETNSQTHFSDSAPIKVGDFIEAVGEEKVGGVVQITDVRRIPPPPLYPQGPAPSNP